MTKSTVNGSGKAARSGAQTLTLLATPLNVPILRALAAGPMQQMALRHQTGLPAQTTLRAQLKRLTAVGAVTRHRRNPFPGTLEYELSPAGAELPQVVDAVEAWLASRPGDPLRLGDDSAKAAIRALTDGWSTTMMRALAAGSRSLTELDRLIVDFNYPSLERRLGAMRLAGLVQAQVANGRSTPYSVTDWLRRGVAPLAAAARWELRHRHTEASPIARIDIETIFMLSMPLSRPGSPLSGSCRIAVELSNAERTQLSGVTVDVIDGCVAACTTDLRNNADAWVHGDVNAWLDAIIEGDDQRLDYGSDCAFARDLVSGVHNALFGWANSIISGSNLTANS